jgi:glyoxylase-like metal-dependent hydrolase (beta-lactamase superfamily II)
MTLELIDLEHHGSKGAVGAYVIETADGPAVVDCGPASCLPQLRRGLAGLGLTIGDVRHLLLTHIHLDHAGAAGSLVREHPALRVHVSPVGAPHLVDPSRLERSARMLYQERFDELWGELVPVPQANVEPVDGRVLDLDVFPTPGHAKHHVSYVDPAGTLFAGDVLGVRLLPSRHVHPASPPPDIDLEGWRASLDEIERRSPERLALTHFGVVEGVDEHLALTREQLDRWAERVRAGMTEEEFVRAALEDLHLRVPSEVERWEDAGSLAQSWAGLRRYWDKQAEAAAQARAG